METSKIIKEYQNIINSLSVIIDDLNKKIKMLSPNEDVEYTKSDDVEYINSEYVSSDYVSDYTCTFIDECYYDWVDENDYQNDVDYVASDVGENTMGNEYDVSDN